jgi:hypothetical protein
MASLTIARRVTSVKDECIAKWLASSLHPGPLKASVHPEEGSLSTAYHYLCGSVKSLQLNVGKMHVDATPRLQWVGVHPPNPAHPNAYCRASKVRNSQTAIAQRSSYDSGHHLHSLD